MIAPGLIRQLVEAARWADVIHLTAVYNFSTIPTLLRAGLGGKPVAWSPRGTLQRWTGSRVPAAKSCWEAMCRLILPRNVALHVTSEAEAAESTARLGYIPAWIIPNGITIPQLPPPPVADGELKLLFIGRLDPKKGLENLISSAKTLNTIGLSNWTLKVLGEGPPEYVAHLHRLIASHGLQTQVEFRGHQTGDGKYQAFADCDVVIVPSHTENFGIVIAEALAHGRPVIAGRGTPWPQIEDRRCGLWVNNDPHSLSKAITQMSCEDRLTMGQRGRKWMETDFSWQERAEKMLSMYQFLLRQ